MNLHELDKARRDAHAAWVAAGRPDRGIEHDTLAQAAKAYAAAKRSASTVDVSAQRIDNAMARQKDRSKAMTDRKNAIRYRAAIHAAYSWPRCGADFPQTPTEKIALEWAITQYGSLDAAIASMGVYS